MNFSRYYEMQYTQCSIWTIFLLFGPDLKWTKHVRTRFLAEKKSVYCKLIPSVPKSQVKILLWLQFCHRQHNLSPFVCTESKYIMKKEWDRRLYANLQHINVRNIQPGIKVNTWFHCCVNKKRGLQPDRFYLTIWMDARCVWTGTVQSLTNFTIKVVVVSDWNFFSQEIDALYSIRASRIEISDYN